MSFGKDQTKQERLAAAAFESAIFQGRLSINPASPLYVADYMFMGFSGGKAMFKNITTRSYIP